ncbi:hypothetical protein DPMN_161390 [Dreissena polymorpha]|uniref:Uncharacterized protein n=1 Tax=Dreissena polymorpha TaxID=45954 RepID=A0A9D4ET23_DREPO|nr:hypothetical protein DPMN_161390 [Dreissena polymorpha]
MAICDGGGVEGRKQENVAEKTSMAICDDGGVEVRIQENVTEKQQWRYVMVAGLKVAKRRTWQKNNKGDM